MAQLILSVGTVRVVCASHIRNTPVCSIGTGFEAGTAAPWRHVRGAALADGEAGSASGTLVARDHWLPPTPLCLVSLLVIALGMPEHPPGVYGRQA